MHSRVKAFVARAWCVPETSIGIDVQPLHGGLDSVVAGAWSTHSQRDRRIPDRLVVKELQGSFTREAGIYEQLWRHLKQPPTVRVLGTDVSGDVTYLYLEHADPVSSWPWSDTRLAALVCRELARLHDTPQARRRHDTIDACIPGCTTNSSSLHSRSASGLLARLRQ